MIMETFPWISVSNTLHKFSAHVHQFIERNSNNGLCNLSEEGLEQGHKLIREFSSHLSRKSNFIKGLNDVATRMYIYGCTVLNEKYRKIIVCPVYGEVRNQKNCQTKYFEEKVAFQPGASQELVLQSSIDHLVLYLTENIESSINILIDL